MVAAPATFDVDTDPSSAASDDEESYATTVYSEQSSRITATFFPDDAKPEPPAPMRRAEDGATIAEQYAISDANLVELEQDPQKRHDDMVLYVLKMEAWKKRNSHGRGRWD